MFGGNAKNGSVADYCSGVSIKREESSRFKYSNRLYQEGAISPLFQEGGRWGEGVSEDVLPQKILKFQSPKKVIFSILGTKVRTKEHVFHSRKCSCHSTFDLSVTINSRKQ